MFRARLTTDPPSDDVTPDPADLVPLSVLALDLPELSAGWGTYLADRDIAVALDDVGRAAIDRSDARQLLAERREQQEAAERKRLELEHQAEQRDRQWRASLPRGIPANDLPDGVSAAQVWAQAEKDSQPHRTSVLEHALERTPGLEYHPIQEDGGWVVGGGDG